MAQITKAEVERIAAEAAARQTARIKAILTNPLSGQYGTPDSLHLARLLAFETDVDADHADRILWLLTDRAAIEHREMAWRLAFLDIPGEPSTGAAWEILKWHAELCPGCNHVPGQPGHKRYTPVEPAKPEPQISTLTYVHPENRTLN